MSVVSRPDTAGRTRTCPHCKATILESLTICPGCLHHLRFDQQAAKRQAGAVTALRVEGEIKHPSAAAEPWEYFVVISVRNERGEEVARQVVNVGALRNTETRSFALSVEVLPRQTVVASKPVAATPPGPAPRAPAPAPKAPIPRAPPSAVRPGSGAAPAGAAVKAGSAAPPKRY